MYVQALGTVGSERLCGPLVMRHSRQRLPDWQDDDPSHWTGYVVREFIMRQPQMLRPDEVREFILEHPYPPPERGDEGQPPPL
jgi:hypothetical protein